jgi:predicted kinase
MIKSIPVLFSKAGGQRGEGSIKNSANVHLDTMKHRYVSNNPDQPGQGQFGAHNVKPGDGVKFNAGSFSGQGRVTAAGEHGAHVADESGREHQVHWHEVHAHEPQGGGQQPAAGQTGTDSSAAAVKQPQPAASDEKAGPTEAAKPSKDPVSPDQFSAAPWAQGHDDPDVTAEKVLESFPPDTMDRMKALDARIKTAGQTIDKYRLSGKDADAHYTPERKKMQYDLIFGQWKDKDGKEHAPILSKEKMEAAKPADGQQPTFVMLGGRGGSGKSWFKKQVYDPKKCIVLDADEIKQRLPEYEGWNAGQVHEESSDLMEWCLRRCMEQGVNVVVDATIKTPKSAIAKAEKFKASGYRFECHYMHLPRVEAAKRAVARFLSPTGRYVPPDVILGNTTNEQSFDQLKEMCDAWSFRDNNVGRGEQPVLISSMGEAMAKALRSVILLLWGKERKGD